MKNLTRCKRAVALLLCALILCVPLLGLAAPAQAGPGESTVSGNEAPEESSVPTVEESVVPEQTEPPTEPATPEQTEPPAESTEPGQTEPPTEPTVPEPEACTCEVKCTADAPNGDCPICKTDVSKCAAKEPEPAPPICTCTVKCAEGAVNQDCPVCKLDRNGCVGKAPEPTPPPEPAYTITLVAPSGWYTKAADVEIRIADLNNTGWQKVEYKIERGGSLIDLTDDLADTDRVKVEITENCTVYVVVTDKDGKAHTKSRYIECFDRTAPTVKAGIDGKMLRVEASDELSGIDAIYIDGDRYEDLTNGTLDVRLRDLDDDYKQISVQSVDYAGNKSKTVQLNNPNYEEPENQKDRENKKSSVTCPETSKPATTGPAITTTTPTTPPATAAPTSATTTAGSTTAKPASTGGGKTSGAGGGTSTTRESGEKQEEKDEATGGMEPEPLTPAGNAGLVDDFYDGEKQLITVTTKSGNYFYILIDRTNEDKESAVHFLNQVDEADLMALMDDGKKEKAPACTCTEKCRAGAVNTACPVCKTNLSECTGPEPQAQEPEEPAAPEKEATGGNTGGLMILLVVVLAGGGAALYYFKFRKPKQSVKGNDDLDEYEFDDEDFEDEEPIKEDEYSADGNDTPEQEKEDEE